MTKSATCTWAAQELPRDALHMLASPMAMDAMLAAY